MKKLLALLLVFVMLFSVATLISGCDDSSKKKGSSSSKDEDEEEEDDEDNEDNEDENNKQDGETVDEDPDENISENDGENLPGFDEKAILSQLIVEEYHYGSDWDSYGVLLVENPTDLELRISVFATFYDSANYELGSAETSTYLGKGGQAVLELNCSTVYSKMEYTLSLQLEEWETNAAEDLSWESTAYSKKEIIAITNHGKETVHNVDVTMLFWHGDKLVTTGGTWIQEIGAGKTRYAELFCFEEYDRIQVVLTGCRAEYYHESQLNEAVIVSQFEVEEHRYRDDWDDYHAVLVVKNNSDLALEVTGCIRFYNSDNQLIGVDEQYRGGLGSGERTVFDYYRDEDFARIEYDFVIHGESWEQSAASSITMETVRGNGKELITVTNHSKKDTVQPSATVLFWGNDGSLVSVEYVDFWVLDPGQSTTAEASCDDVYADAEVILSASVYETIGETDKNFNAEQVASKLTASYYGYEDYYGEKFLLLVVENTSKYYLGIGAEITFYDENDRLIGASYTDSHRVGIGNKTVLQCEAEEAYARVEYQFWVEQVRDYEAADSDMSWTEADGTISMTNNGDRMINDVTAYVVFWKDGEVVGYDTYWHWELEPGAVIPKSHYYDDYDNMDVYLHGGYPVEYRYELSAAEPIEGQHYVIIEGEEWQ